MHPTRRELIRLGLGSSALLACGPTVPLFLASSAAALADEPGRAAASKTGAGRILVVVQLSGGNDGLNTVVPYRDDEYRKQRPGLQIATKEVLKIDDHIGLHPRSMVSASYWNKSVWRSFRASAIPTPTARISRAWPSGTQPGWIMMQPHLAGPGDRPAPDRRETHLGSIFTTRFLCRKLSKGVGT